MQIQHTIFRKYSLCTSKMTNIPKMQAARHIPGKEVDYVQKQDWQWPFPQEP